MMVLGSLYNCNYWRLLFKYILEKKKEHKSIMMMLIGTIFQARKRKAIHTSTYLIMCLNQMKADREYWNKEQIQLLWKIVIKFWKFSSVFVSSSIKYRRWLWIIISSLLYILEYSFFQSYSNLYQSFEPINIY